MCVCVCVCVCVNEFFWIFSYGKIRLIKVISSVLTKVMFFTYIPYNIISNITIL